MSKYEKIIFATHNKGKLRELREILCSHVGGDVTSSGELGLEEPEENGNSFSENALIKARSAAAAVDGCVAIGEDSGLCVNALDGFPGINSKRWADENGGMEPAMKKIWEKLDRKEDKSAFFICVMAAKFPDGSERIFEGRINGKITWPIRGASGFGYDPIFVPGGYEKTFAEMGEEEKNRISHRSIALSKLISALSE